MHIEQYFVSPQQSKWFLQQKKLYGYHFTASMQKPLNWQPKMVAYSFFGPGNWLSYICVHVILHVNNKPKTGHLLPCAGVTSTPVRRPLNSAVVQGEVVTLQCSSNVTNSVLVWYNTLCVTTASSIADCRDDRVYTGYNVLGPFSPRFHITPVNNATHVTRDLNIDSAQLSDAGVYLCAEEGPGVAADTVVVRSAQLIVLGNCATYKLIKQHPIIIKNDQTSHWTIYCLFVFSLTVSYVCSRYGYSVHEG